MPTLKYLNDGFAATDESSSTATPQSIQVSIALSPHPHVKPACSSTEKKTKVLGKQSNTTLKHPPQGGQPETHDSAASGARDRPRAQLNEKPVSAFVAASAALPAAQAPFKRTKRIAKPRTSKGAKASLSRARKLTTKKRGGGRTGPKFPVAGATVHTESFQGGVNIPSTLSKQSSISVEGGEGTSSTLEIRHGPAKTDDSKSNGLVSSPSQGNDEPITKKRKKAKKANSGNAPTTKPIHVQGGGNTSSPAPCAGGSPKRAKCLSNKTDTGDLQIKKAVDDVIDRVADGIHHCAFMFELTNRPKVIISSKSGEGSSEETSGAPTTTHCSLKVSADGALLSAMKQSAPACSSYVPQGCSVSIHNALPVPQKGSDPDLHGIHTVIEAVRRFAMDVHCPFFLSARQSMRNKSHNVDRIRLSTLLAVREMLIMNADNLFTFATLKQSPKSSSERLYLVHVFSNAIVRNAAKRLHSNAEHGQFFADFVQAAHNYDTNSEDFHFSLSRLDARSICVYQGGKQVGAEESILAKIGFNHARQRHPLLHKDRCSRKTSIDNGMPLTCPVPTACAAFHIEAADTRVPDEREDLQKMKSFRRMLRDKRKRL